MPFDHTPAAKDARLLREGALGYNPARLRALDE
jgi:hypothetical protein